MNRAASVVAAVVLAVIAAGWAASRPAATTQGGQTPAPPTSSPATVPATTPASIESDLVEALNEARTEAGLAPLKLDERLLSLARQHSASMARRGQLVHESETGAPYQQRLVDAGVSSVVSGENIGRSTAAFSRLIHNSFMDSPSHRANMLSPAFDHVGIGVALAKGGTYFVTMDFIRSFAPVSTAGIRDVMLTALNQSRERSKRIPLVVNDAANAAAEQQAKARAESRPAPPLPWSRQRTSARFAIGQDLAQLADALRGEDLDGYGTAGIGSAFMRGGKYPGGAYVICVVLVWDGR
jgi:uncharacterized protein YkwD